MKQNKRNRQMVDTAELKKQEALVHPVLEKVVNALGFDLFELLFVRENQENYLRLTIVHKDRSVSTNDCEIVSRAVSKELDSMNTIPFPYILEIQSKRSDEAINPLLKHEFILEKVGLTVRS